MNTLDAIKNRRSIRKYKKGAEIPMEDIKAMLEAAMLAPSARNCRPWGFTVIRDRDIMTKIMDISPYTKMMETASLAIVVCGRPVSKTCCFQPLSLDMVPAGAGFTPLRTGISSCRNS